MNDNKTAGHTPPPWIVHNGRIVRTKNDAMPVIGAALGKAGPFVLAKSEDLQLAATSPELLAELVKMTDAYAKAMSDAGVTQYPETLAVVRASRDVIAKAEGR